ncbi:MAG: GTPase, partial [Desulfurococcales archaeon]|nr:GTPase [Desulfurococcales archaeon]
RALAAGASFMILGPKETMLYSSKPVIAVTAVRTGCGKSTVSRALVERLSKEGLRVVPIRHPMAYGDLAKMAVQRFASYEDLDRYNVTVEEREEYEQYIRLGLVVYAGVDYGKVLAEAEKEADVILWDGGNNDWPFIKPDYMITVADAMRPGQEISSFPGEVNARMADLVIINKADQAKPGAIEEIKRNIARINPKADIAVAESVVTVDQPELISGKRVIVLEDSPTVTHGRAPYAAGYVAATKYGASEIVDPRPYAVGIIKELYEEYPHMGPVLPSTGYTEAQLRDLEETINRIDADAVVMGTPADITRLIKINKPVVRVRYELRIIEGPSIDDIIKEFLDRVKDKLPQSK